MRNYLLKELYAILKVRQEVFIVEQTCYYLDAEMVMMKKKAFIFLQKKKGRLLPIAEFFSQNIKYPKTSIGRVLTIPNLEIYNWEKTLIKFALETIETRFKTKSC